MSDDATVQHLIDQLRDDAVTSRSMFGGQGVYKAGRMFALVYDGAVYMKFSDETADESGRPAFSPSEGKIFRTFRQVSAEELDDPGALASLAAEAYAAAG